MTSHHQPLGGNVYPFADYPKRYKELRADELVDLYAGLANAAVAAPRHSGFAPSRKSVSAIRRVSTFAVMAVCTLYAISLWVLA